MKPLGFGRVMIFEVDESSNNETPNFTTSLIDAQRFTNRLEATKVRLKRMENYRKEGRWDQVIVQLRDVDLLTKFGMKADIKKLLKKTLNLPEDKSVALTTALDNLYSFSSQLHHSVDNDEVNPDMNVNKEDADFGYVVMLAITQLLEKKLQILRKSNS